MKHLKNTKKKKFYSNIPSFYFFIPVRNFNKALVTLISHTIKPITIITVIKH